MYPLVKEAMQRKGEHVSRMNRDPEFWIMSTDTMYLLIEELSHQNAASPWKTPPIKGRPYILMGIEIRICETVDGIHVAS